MIIRYGIVAIRSLPDGLVEIVHFCGYETKPTNHDFNGLYQELSTDSEFDLVGKMDNIVLVEATKEMLKHYATELDDAEDLKFDV